MNLRKYLDDLDNVHDDVAETVAAGIANDVSQWAAINGHPDLVREYTPAASRVEVRKYLAAAIAATAEPPEPGPEPLLSPPEIARQLGADPATVIQWIRTGQLKASNLATGHRPRYVVQPSDLEAFLKARQLGQRKRS